jgi:hypothetical protein
VTGFTKDFAIPDGVSNAGKSAFAISWAFVLQKKVTVKEMVEKTYL